MAKRSRGIFGMVGGIWRLTVVALAMVLLFAVYLNVTAQNEEDVALEAIEPPAAAPDVAAAETDELEMQDATEEEQTTEPAAVAEQTIDIADRAEESDGSSAGDETLFGELAFAGDDATYEVLDALQRDDGSIEVTTKRVPVEGASETVTRLVTCAPFAVGVITKNNGDWIDPPEMERIALGSPEASIAAAACGVFR